MSTPARAPEYSDIERSWGKFHSKRYAVTVSLPDGKAWKIDDHKAPELVAVHPPTQSRLSLIATEEVTLMNRQRCEERARRTRFFDLKETTLTTVEDEVHVGPEAYDSRVWVSIDASKADGSVEGHIFLFGAFLRRCLLIHLATSVPSAKDEQVLASRLAIASTRVVKGVALDPLRTTIDAQPIPRDRP